MTKLVQLKDGTQLSSLGQGTWMLGENPKARTAEKQSIIIGIENGVTLIDTAEMYGSGASESLIGEAIQGYDRSKLFLVSKVYPHNAGRNAIFQSCAASLQRLGTDSLDLYLLHWRGSVPLSETVECMEELVKQGLIKRWGVSNFDVDDMQELLSVKHGDRCMVNQVLYHLGSRGIEYSLYPWLKKQGIVTMAYCPVAQGGDLKEALLGDPVLSGIAASYGISVIELLLCWVLSKEQIIAIPRTSNPDHAYQNAKALDINFRADDIEQMEAQFPSPTRKVYLDIV